MVVGGLLVGPAPALVPPLPLPPDAGAVELEVTPDVEDADTLLLGMVDCTLGDVVVGGGWT